MLLQPLKLPITLTASVGAHTRNPTPLRAGIAPMPSGSEPEPACHGEGVGRRAPGSEQPRQEGEETTGPKTRGSSSSGGQWDPKSLFVPSREAVEARDPASDVPDAETQEIAKAVRTNGTRSTVLAERRT